MTLYSFKGHYPVEQIDNNKGWYEVPAKPETAEGKEVAWCNGEWVVRDPKPKDRPGYQWNWNHGDMAWIECKYSNYAEMNMAHFAQLDENNVVMQVIVVNNDVLLDNGVEKEELGIEFCKSLFGGNWVQTSYNANFRGKYAGIGDTYDPIKDEFVSPVTLPISE